MQPEREMVTMNASHDLIEELEGAIATKGVSHRAEMLRRVTDLFAAVSERFDERQVALFDDVMGRLVSGVDSSVRVAVAQRLAPIANAPATIIQTLALDEAIEVAGPVLALSERLDEDTLIISAKTRSQSHLLMISRRRVIGEAVTDVLVERGSQEVAVTVAANHGARFSDFGYSRLVERSEHDEELAIRVWMRPEIPRQHLLKLVMIASAAVQRRLEAADRRKMHVFSELVAEARDQILAQARERSAQYAATYARLLSEYQQGKLIEADLLGFARARKFDEVTIALSLICELPIGLVERAIVDDRCEQILVIGKAIGAAWETVRALLQLKAESSSGAWHDLDQCAASFARLQPETAKKALQFYRLREQTKTPSVDGDDRAAVPDIA
jgi:uncharacterized protein (DUF2336 family)